MIRILLLAVVMAASLGEAATILERRIDLVIEGQSLRERRVLLVSLDEVGDLDAWSEYSVFVDDDIELEEASFEVFDAHGKRLKSVPKRKLREVTSVGSGLHSSGRILVAELPALAVGQRLRFEIVRLHTPINKAYRVPLQLDSTQEKLEITVRGDGLNLRTKLHDPDGLVEKQELNGGFRFEGADLPIRVPPDHAGSSFAVAPALWLVWGDTHEWPALGAWYRDLTAEVARGHGDVEKLASDLTRGLSTTREKLVVLTDYARRDVRYEAVEVGVGGWIPTPAHETISRGWGDCKDKSELLAELLRAVGISSHLVLIHNGFSGHMDSSFVTTLGFNHCILAVPGEEFGSDEDIPMTEGLLFLDPTLDRGHALWPSPYLQGQWALVVAARESRLVRLPVRIEKEGRRLEINGRLSPLGDLSADVSYFLSGSRALGWLRDLDSRSPGRLHESVHTVMQRLIPGAKVSRVAVRDLDQPVPTVVLEARLRVEGFARGGSSHRMKPSMLSALPEPRELEDRNEPCVLRPGIHTSVWKLQLPADWCLPGVATREVTNALGELVVTIGPDGEHGLVIERRTVVRSRWTETEAIDDLAVLSIAESQENRRSLRLRCTEGDE